jgi:hypothetical protein
MSSTASTTQTLPVVAPSTPWDTLTRMREQQAEQRARLLAQRSELIIPTAKPAKPAQQPPQRESEEDVRMAARSC